ncbi:MAG TPA: glycosyltransferase family 9 protein [Pyrinomonadaceae bacterium]
MIDWTQVERVLVIRLRSIGDTVLSTPSLFALRRFLPAARIDILLEDWVAPVLDGLEFVDNVIRVEKGAIARMRTALQLRRDRYDVVFNLHGGTTATFLTRGTGAPHRVGYRDYQYSFLHNHLSPPASEFWESEKTHSAEQQLALLGSVGVPVSDRPRSSLAVTPAALAAIDAKAQFDAPFALIHPAAAFATKQWAAENFARIAEYFAACGIKRVAVAAGKETDVLDELTGSSRVPITTFDDLSLPEITALASRAAIFVGNDSGIAHVAAAVGTPSVVIFGSSNRDHWRPWTDAPNEIVFEEFDCQPCPGYRCEVFGEPKCIQSVRTESVIAAIDRVLKKAEHDAPPS